MLAERHAELADERDALREIRDRLVVDNDDLRDELGRYRERFGPLEREDLNTPEHQLHAGEADG